MGGARRSAGWLQLPSTRGHAPVPPAPLRRLPGRRPRAPAGRGDGDGSWLCRGARRRVWPLGALCVQLTGMTVQAASVHLCMGMRGSPESARGTSLPAGSSATPPGYRPKPPWAGPGPCLEGRHRACRQHHVRADLRQPAGALDVVTRRGGGPPHAPAGGREGVSEAGEGPSQTRPGTARCKGDSRAGRSACTAVPHPPSRCAKHRPPPAHARKPSTPARMPCATPTASTEKRQNCGASAAGGAKPMCV